MRLVARGPTILALLVFLLSLPTRAGAQGGEPPDPRAMEEAEGAFRAGQAAYDAGRFPEALSYFERVYELTNDPDVLYNVATVHDRMRHDEQALEAYRAYLEARPDSEDRDNIQARVRALEENLAGREAREPEPEPEAVEPEPGPEPETAPEPTVEPSAGDVGPGPWIVIGVGGAAAVASGILFGLMASDFSTVEGASAVPWEGEVRDAYQRAPQLFVAGVVTGAVGLAAIAAGLVWLAVGAPSEDAEVAIGPGGVRWRGGF